MSQKNKPFTPNSRVWQRHALAKACALAIAGAGAVAQAAVVPGAALLTTYGTVENIVQMTGSTPWQAGYNSPWINSETQLGSIFAPISNSSIGSSLTAATALGGASAVSITGNRIFAPGMANEAITPITTLNRVSASDDGILSLNLQIFTGLADDPDPANATAYAAPSEVRASLINTSVGKPGTVYITQTGLSAANLSLSTNVLGASATLNSLNATVAVATPANYASTSKGSSSLAFDADSMAMGAPATPTSGSTGSVNMSNMQGVFNAMGIAEVKDVKAVVTVSETVGNLSSTISANSNSITATTTNNTAVSIFRSTSDSAAFTGTVGVTNLQSTNVVEGVTASQLASVAGSGVKLDLRNADGEGGVSAVTGAVTVNNNTVSATVMGNTAGAQSSSGSIAAGNALIFEGSSNITGVNNLRGEDGELQAAIGTGTSQAQADLLINNVQRNIGNAFTASLGTATAGTEASITSNIDTLSGAGSLTQSGNSLNAIATNNLSGNLISAGQSGSVGGITASAVVLNSQNNNTVTTLAEAQSASISATIGSTDVISVGTATVSSNTISASAQGNLTANSVLLKADNLTVGSYGASRSVELTPSTSSASSGLAVSVLNAQTNNALDLKALNEGGSMALSFKAAADTDIDATLATMDGNRLSSTAAANSALNQVVLQSTNASGLNSGLGNLQSNTTGTAVASSGASDAPLTLSLSVGDVSTGEAIGSSRLTQSNNSISSQVQLNSANNSLSASGTTSTGTGVVPSALAGDLSDGSARVNADLALVNAQINASTSASATSYGEISVSTGAMAGASAITSLGNQVTALAEGNLATNALALTSGTMSGMSAGLVSVQRGSDSDITAAGYGAVSVSTGAVSGASNVTTQDNAIKSTAVSNTVGNTLSLAGANATGATNAPVTQISYNLTQMEAAADLTLINQQKTNGSAVSATTGVSGAAATVSLTTGAVTEASTLTFSNNTVSAAALTNNATNAASVQVGNLTSMTTVAGNAQTATDGSLSATVYGQANVAVASVDAGNLSANLNAVTATARANTAENSLSLDATTVSGRGTQSSFTVTGDVITADQVLSNAQSVSNQPVSALTAGDVSLTSTGSVASAANVSLTNSTVSAYASSNFASNQVDVAATHASNTTSALVSMQAASRSPVADAVTAATRGSVGLSSGELIGASLNLSGNAIKATALDNVASNQMTLSGATLTGAASGEGGVSMTGLVSSISTQATSSVAADAMLVNMQASALGNLSADTGSTESPVKIALEFAGANTATSSAAALTAKDNSISSLVFANNATNTLGLSVTTINDMTIALSNAQQLAGGTLKANTVGSVEMTSSDDVNVASLTLEKNSLVSTAGGNEAGNKLTVTSTDVVGRDMGSRITNAGNLKVATDFAVGNEQQITAGSTLNASTKGNVLMGLTAQAVDTSTLALSANILSAYGSANNASNQLTMTASNISQSSLGLASRQSLDLDSTVESDVTGSIRMTSGAVTDASLSATENSIKATALGNVAGNSLNVTAASYTGPTALASAVNTQAISATQTSSTADIALASVQNNLSQAAVSATTNGTAQMAVGAVAKDTGVSSNSLADNSLLALAQSNSVSNSLQLKITQFSDATAAMTSYQDSNAEVTASLSPDSGSSSGGLFAVTSSGSLTNAAIAVTGNKASALAGINEAFNTLTVTGANLLGRAGPITVPSAGEASSTGADFVVMNTQAAATSAAATVAAGTSGFKTTGVMLGGTVSVSGNEVLARASANTANNTLTMSASNRLEASGVVNNVQSMANDTTVSATVSTGSTIGAEFGSSAAVDGGVVSVNNNNVTAQATGNVANNALNATATTGIASAGSNATSPTFAVLNYQTIGTSSTGIQAAINGVTVGGTQLNGALNGGSFNTTGNQILSVAYGNSANNAVNVSALAPGLNTASASITNVQYNMASVTASVKGAHVQGSGTVGTTGGSVNISGNSIMAMAVGNRSVGSISGR